jgi:hypothetical protein
VWNGDFTMHDEREDVPGAGDEAAAAAVFDQALTEALHGEVPPDVSAMVFCQQPATAPPRYPRWLLAALVIFGIGAVVAVRMSLSPRSSGSAADELTAPIAGVGAELRDCRGMPRDLAELNERLARYDTASVSASAIGVWSPELVRWVALLRHEWDSFLRFGLNPGLDGDDAAEVVAALRGASPIPPSGVVVWTHRVDFTSAKDAVVLLLQVGGPTPPRVGCRFCTGDQELAVHSFPFATLMPLLRDNTATTITKLGFWIGERGFDTLRADASKLTLIDVPAAAASALARFQRLSQLDLRQSPEWHDPAVLKQLARVSLTALQLAPRSMTPDGYRALPGCKSLRELWLGNDNFLSLLLSDQRCALEPRLDNAAMAAIAELTQIEQLAIAGGVFDDDGVAHLGKTTNLRRLFVYDAQHPIGGGIGRLRHLQGLVLRGPLAVDVLQHVPPGAFEELGLLGGTQRLTLVPRNDVAPRQLLLQGNIERAELTVLARYRSLEALRLDLHPPLADHEVVLLEPLRELPKLKRLGLVSTALTDAGRARLQQLLPKVRLDDDLW